MHKGRREEYINAVIDVADCHDVSRLARAVRLPRSVHLVCLDMDIVALRYLVDGNQRLTIAW